MIGHAAALGEVFNVTAEAVTTRHYVTTLATIVGVEPDIVEVPDDRAGRPACTAIFGHLFGCATTPC